MLPYCQFLRAILADPAWLSWKLCVVSIIEVISRFCIATLCYTNWHSYHHYHYLAIIYLPNHITASEAHFSYVLLRLQRNDKVYADLQDHHNIIKRMHWSAELTLTIWPHISQKAMHWSSEFHTSSLRYTCAVHSLATRSYWWPVYQWTCTPNNRYHVHGKKEIAKWLHCCGEG